MKKIYSYFLFFQAILTFLFLSMFSLESQAQIIVQDSFFSECRRSVEFRVSGGVAPYTYVWSFEGEVVQTNSNLSGSQSSVLTQAQAGTYTVSVTDNVGNTLVRNFSFLGVTNFELDVMVEDIVVCGNETTAVITGEINGGLAPYTIRFFDLDGNLVRTINNFPGGQLSLNGIPAGQYLVEVEDANLCIELTNIEIPEIEPIELNPAVGVGTFPATCGDNGGVSFVVEGFSGEVRYRIIERRGNRNFTVITGWTVAPGGVIFYDQLPSGNYVLEIIDLYRNEDCPFELDFTIGSETLLDFTATSTDITCFGETDGTITLRADRVFMGFAFPPQSINVDIIGPNGNTIVNNATIPIGTNSGEDTFTGLGPGTYTIRVRHGGVNYPLCEQQLTVTIEAPSSGINLNTSSSPLSCFGENDGTATVIASGGWRGFTYRWSNGATTATATGLAPGNYSVTVTDAEGCTAVANVTVTGPPSALTASINGLNELTCAGSNDGSAQVTNVSGGWGNYTYLWSSGETTPIAYNLPSGPNTVTIRDSGGCELVLNVNIGVPPAPNVTSSPVRPTCFGGSDGSLRIQIADNTRTFAVTVNGVTLVGNDVLFENLQAGTYFANIAYDGGACQIIHEATISAPPQIIINDANLNIQNVLCHGNGNGSITGLQVIGGTGALTYQWQVRSGGSFVNMPGQTGLNLFNLSGGVYRIVVRDANNCTVNRQFEILEPSPLSVNGPVVTNVNCYGEDSGTVSFSISGGTAPYTYRLNGGTPVTTFESNVTITGLTASNNNFIEVRDANNCQVPNLNFNITSLPEIVVDSINVTPEVCAGQNNGSIRITFSGGSGSLGVQWFVAGNFSTVLSNSATLNNRGPGEYTARIFDLSNPNCFILQNITIPPTPVIDLQLAGPPTNVSCFGEETGAININVSGGTGGFTYQWTGPNGFTANTQNISDIPGGLYTVRVTDANGCFRELNNILVSQPPSGVQINVLNIIEPTCYDSENGRIEIQAAGGNPGYTYEWFKDEGMGILAPVPGTSSTLSNIGSGNYVVRVTDTNGCSNEELIAVNGPDPIQINVLSVDDISCVGRNDGRIFIEVTGGTGIYFFSWDHGFINQNPTNLSAGSYAVTVRDANGCEARIENIIVDEPELLEIDLIEAVAPTCAYNDGSIEVSFSGGLPGLANNQWYNAQTGDLIATNTTIVSGLTPGFYSVEFNNGANCTISKIIRLPGPPSPLRILASTQDPICPGETGLLNLSATGGVPGYTFQIFLGGIWRDVNNSILSSLTVGDYDVRVTDSTGCEDNTTITINDDNEPLFYTVEVEQDVSCFNGNDGIINFEIFGNLTNISSIQWYRRTFPSGAVAINSLDLNNLIAGTYYFVLTYVGDCTTASEDYVITQPEELVVSTNQVQPICADDFGSFQLTVNGGKPGKTIQIDSPNGTNIIYDGENTGVFIFDNLPPGNYTWSVEDPGCGITSGNFTVNAVIKPSFSFNSQDISCFGANDGILNIIDPIVASGRTFTVLINNVSQGSMTSFNNLAPGNYQVRIMDNFGCLSDPVLVTISGPSRPLDIINFNKVDGECFGTPTGRISFEVEGGRPLYRAILTNTAGLSLELSDLAGNTIYEFENLVAGDYTLNIIDRDGICQVSRNFVITQPDFVTVNYVSPEISCEPNLTYISLTITGGQQPYIITWERFNYGTSTWELIPYNGLLLDNIGAGLYRYTVEDANACGAISEDVLVEAPPLFNLDYTKGEILCFGGNTIIEFSASFGNADNFTFYVNGSQIFGNLFTAVAGIYTAYAINNVTGCRSEDILIQVAQPTAPLTLQQFTSENLSCYESGNGRISFTLIGGTAPYIINFQGETFTGNEGEEIVFDNLLANVNYSFTATDSNGCPVLIPSRTLSQPLPIQVNVSNTEIRCSGNLARINLQVTGGITPYEINWAFSTDGINFIPDPGLNNATQLTNLSGGYYRYTITDQGCDPIEDVVYIHEPLPIQVIPEVINVTCHGESTGAINLDIRGGTGSYSVQWSNGMIGSSISGLRAGIYTVFIVDENSCVISRTYTITQPDTPIQVEADFATFYCSFDDEISLDINVTGGTAPYTFLWSNGSTSQNLVGIEPGSYTVRITDAEGCEIEATYEIPPRILPIEIELEANQALCSPGERAEITANVTGGSGPYTYLWSNGATTPIISNLGPGTYTLTVTDTNGCRAQESIEILPAPNWRLNLEALSPVSCFGGNDGSIQLSLIEAREPVSIRWSHGLEGQLFAGNLTAGTYSVTVEDSLGCTITSAFNIREPEILTLTEVVENSQCAGFNNGSISLNIQGGSAPYTFRWSHGPNSRNLRNLAPGDYSVVVTDRNGCSTAANYTILEPEPLEIISDFTEELLCHGDMDGFIRIDIQGGIQPYEVTWSDDPNLSSLYRSNLPAGVYTVSIRDDNDCRIEQTFNIQEPDRLEVRLETRYEVDCENQELVGVAFIDIIGGKGDYSIFWSNGDTDVMETFFYEDGELSVMVYDENGCFAEDLEVIVMPLAFSEADFTYSVISLGTIGEILVNDPVQFIDKTLGNVIVWEWDFGDGTKSNEQNPTHTYKKPGIYTITLMTFDALGCVSSTSIEVEVLSSYRIMVPNAFTPNGDGINDTFIPKMRGIDEFEMHIFNKWGELIYSCFDREDKGWDGTLRGVMSPNGNYVYKIVFKANDGEKGSQTGVFTLVL
jgi:gliding motility-associated-like protein